MCRELAALSGEVRGQEKVQGYLNLGFLQVFFFFKLVYLSGGTCGLAKAEFDSGTRETQYICKHSPNACVLLISGNLSEVLGI